MKITAGVPKYFVVAKKNAIELFHLQRLDNQSVFLIEGECSKKILIIKIKKFACKTLKGRVNKSRKRRSRANKGIFNQL